MANLFIVCPLCGHRDPAPAYVIAQTAMGHELYRNCKKYGDSLTVTSDTIEPGAAEAKP